MQFKIEIWDAEDLEMVTQFAKQLQTARDERGERIRAGIAAIDAKHAASIAEKSSYPVTPEHPAPPPAPEVIPLPQIATAAGQLDAFDGEIEIARHASAEPAPTPAPDATLADVQNAVRRVYDRKGMPAAVTLLESFGVRRADELSAAQYGAVIGKAQEITA